MKKILLIGNPMGKSHFQHLTGAASPPSNYPGTTVCYTRHHEFRPARRWSAAETAPVCVGAGGDVNGPRSMPGTTADQSPRRADRRGDDRGGRHPGCRRRHQPGAQSQSHPALLKWGSPPSSPQYVTPGTKASISTGGCPGVGVRGAHQRSHGEIWSWSRMMSASAPGALTDDERGAIG